MAEEQEITKEHLAAAEVVIGLEFNDAERELMLDGVRGARKEFEKLRGRELPNSAVPAISFSPRLPEMEFDTTLRSYSHSAVEAPEVPDDLEEVAFWPVTKLAALIKARRVTSVALTEMYLGRLKRYDPVLRGVITLMEEQALAQARQADEEIGRGEYRGPLHGIPWGAKDLLATDDAPTTWGAEPWREQQFDYNATVVERLDAAGAVLVAKLSVGALAWVGVELGDKQSCTSVEVADQQSSLVKEPIVVSRRRRAEPIPTANATL